MPRVTDGEKKKRLRDMRALIDDYAKENKFPTNTDFAKLHGLTKPTIIAYKKEIQDVDKQSLLEIFGTERIMHVKKAKEILLENIKIFKEIRDDDVSKPVDRINAGQSAEEAALKVIQLQYDAQEYLYDEGDVNDSTKEYANRQEEETKTIITK